MEKTSFKKAYIMAVDMGYGHERAVYPLKDIAAPCEGSCFGESAIISANQYPGIPSSDRRRWEGGRKLYEAISRLKSLPVFGDWIFSIMDHFQKIEQFYPARDLSTPNIQLKQIYGMIHRGWGRDLIERLNARERLPLVSSFFTPAFFAEEHRYKGDIYLLCCDADVSRAWAPFYPAKSRIKYLVPNRRVKERLQLYGIQPEKIFVTGFPLPKENLGGTALKILKKSLGHRIVQLDPKNRYRKKYQQTIDSFLGSNYCDCKNNCPLTITFAVGGAGVQRVIGVAILKSLRAAIDKGKIRLNLVAGTRNDVYVYYQQAIRELHLNKRRNGHVRLIYAETKSDYFRKFNETLLDTDILWTKPSELSFYAGLGLPIIIAPTIGSQEEFNKDWLLATGAGVPQQDPRYTNEWLFDWLESGWLAEAAMKGFLDAPRNGVYHIEQVVLKGRRSEIEDIHLL